MMNKLMDIVEKAQIAKAGSLTAKQAEVMKSSVTRNVPKFNVGDTVDVHLWIEVGEKGRQQIFSGTVISKTGSDAREAFTVRKIVQGEGVERVFTLHSPKISKIEVKRAGAVRRAKLYYLRDRVGKATRVKEFKDHKAAKPAKAKAAK